MLVLSPLVTGEVSADTERRWTEALGPFSVMDIPTGQMSWPLGGVASLPPLEKT